ncbi:HEPN domain-containing protein [Bacillus sp. BR_7]|uniref:hypothetical protein n=1 Tax=Bacillus sp. BR_7 TaxID=3055774 RepID=UPI0035C03B7A
MHNYLVCRLLSDKGKIIPYSIGYGDVEIRNVSRTFSGEKKYLLESMDKFEEKVNMEIAPLISTIVQGNTPDEADYLAEIKFQQVLDCQNAELNMGKILLLKSGFIKNMDTRWESPRLKGFSLEPSAMFKVNRRFIPRIDETQYVLAVKDSELKRALQRALHWIRRSDNEMDLHLKCLFLWFAIECITKVGEEDITGKIMQTMGFPLGKIGLYIPKEKVDGIKKHSDYEFLRKKLEKQLGEIRELRNKTVHEGFRSWDLPMDALDDYYNILSLAMPRIRRYAIQGLKVDLKTITELWEYFPLLYEKFFIINDFHNTVLYSLKNKIIDFKLKSIMFNE